jgi:hypothetical protein
MFLTDIHRCDVCHAVVPAPEPQTAEWVQKHRPQSLKDIAVAKKKVQEAQQWLEPFKDGAPHPAYPRVLLLTGASCRQHDADGNSYSTTQSVLLICTWGCCPRFQPCKHY